MNTVPERGFHIYVGDGWFVHSPRLSTVRWKYRIAIVLPNRWRHLIADRIDGDA